MLLLGIWYNLSDEKVEESVNDSLSMMRFCDLSIEDSVPDHSVLSRFRTELTEKKAFDRLFKKINRQLAAHTRTSYAAQVKLSSAMAAA
jgi:IS5 family transposase